jgi:hypothetical protein
VKIDKGVGINMPNIVNNFTKNKNGEIIEGDGK